MHTKTPSAAEGITALIYKDHEYDSVAMVERRRWRVALSNGRRRFTTSRREAIEWCEEFGVPYTITKRPTAPGAGRA